MIALALTLALAPSDPPFVRAERAFMQHDLTGAEPWPAEARHTGACRSFATRMVPPEGRTVPGAPGVASLPRRR